MRLADDPVQLVDDDVADAPAKVVGKGLDVGRKGIVLFGVEVGEGGRLLLGVGAGPFGDEAEAGDVVLREGEEAVGFYIISSGQLEVVKDLGGSKETVLARFGPGEFFGETALLDGYPRTASIRAMEDGRCLVMSRWDFLAELKSSPDMAAQLLRTLARRLRQTDARLTE